MVHTARAQKRELGIDKMIIALVDHDRQLQFSKKTKELPTQLSHKKNSEKRISQEIPILSSSPPAAKHNPKNIPCNHCGSARHNKQSFYLFLLADKKTPGWKPFAGKEDLLKENMAGIKIAKSVKSMKVALTLFSKLIQDAEFYLDSTADVHMTYNRSFFSIYRKIQLSPMQMAGNSKLRVLDKDTVSLKVMMDGKALQVNFLNVFYSPDLEYNLFSVDTIKEPSYSVRAKNEKITVFDNNDNAALVETQIRT